jgi:hypothetical protein
MVLTPLLARCNVPRLMIIPYAKLLSRWGHLSDIAIDLRVPLNTVVAWQRRDSVPHVYWVALLGSAHRRGIRLSQDELLNAADLLRDRRRKPQPRAKRSKRVPVSDPTLHPVSNT